MKIIHPLVHVVLLIICLGVFQNAYAVSPPPDGGYPIGNTAEGEDALLSLGNGTYNTAVGYLSLKANTRGNFNTAIGAGALLKNRDATENTAVGASALQENDFQTGCNRNSAMGAFSLSRNVTGSSNTAFGNRALANNTTGSRNIAVGTDAGGNVSTADNVICIGAGGNNAGNSCFIGQIFGATSPNGTAVFINSSGKLGTAMSSRRFKEEIKPMECASEALFALKPVTFRYKKLTDPEGITQFGLIAEDVEKINPDLVVRDKDGKPYSVRYEQINAMLLNEFLKEHRKNEQQEATIARQQKQIEELRAGLQRVSNQIETAKSMPQIAIGTQ
jgi:hypothetical protein